MNRFVFGFLAAALVTSAHSSFELVLVADAGSKKIHRFDGLSGAYLGNFGLVGGVRGAATSIVADVNSGTCFINEGTGLNQYNYSTGALIRSFGNVGTVTSFTLSRDGKSIFTFNNTNAFQQYSLSTGALVKTITSTTTGLKFSSGAESLTSEWVVQDTSIVGSNRIRRIFANGDTSTGVLLPVAATSGSASTTMRMDLSSLLGSSFSNMLTTFAAGASFGFSGSAAIGAPLYYYIDLGQTSFSSSVFLTAGSHAGGYCGGKDAGGNWLFARYAPTLSELNNFSNAQITNPIAMTTVLAPEPATMVVLGAGLAFLARGRRKK